MPGGEKIKTEFRINRRIRASEVRLLDEENQQAGIVSIGEALRRAEEVGLDLVEVAPNANPPVCRIVDYKKLLYERKKRQRQARKKQKQVEVKEVKFRPTINDHDYQIKLRHIKEFLEEDYRVKVTIVYKGRQIVHPEIAERLVSRLKDDTKDVGTVESVAKHGARIRGLFLIKKK